MRMKIHGSLCLGEKKSSFTSINRQSEDCGRNYSNIPWCLDFTERIIKKKESVKYACAAKECNLNQHGDKARIALKRSVM